MPTNTDNDAAAVQAGIHKVQAEIDRIEKTVDRVDFSNRFEFHNQLDVLSQRNAALSREVTQLQAVTDPGGRKDIRNRVQTELAELQRAVGQVAGRVDRGAIQATESR